MRAEGGGTGRLDGKVAWVTGAGSGIGQAAATALAEEGATAVLTGRRPDACPNVRGMFFFGFPPQPAGKPSVDRAAHLAPVRIPMLFL